MTLQIPPGYMLVFHPLFHGDAQRQWGVTVGYDISSAVGTNTEIVTEADQSFRATWQAPMDSNVQFQAARAQIGNDGPPLVAVSTESPINGLRSGAVPPPQVATGITKRTAFGGRAFRGRNYFPGLVQDAEVSEVGLISTTRTSNLQIIATDWLDGLAGSTLQPWPIPMVLLHGQPSAGGPIPAPTPVTTLEVQRVVRTQRRRLG